MFWEITDKVKQLKEPNRNRIEGTNRKAAEFIWPHNFIAIRGNTSFFLKKGLIRGKINVLHVHVYQLDSLLVNYLSPNTDLHIDPPTLRQNYKKYETVPVVTTAFFTVCSELLIIY